MGHERKDAHLCLAGGWQGQHSGLGPWQTALTVVHPVGHVCPSRITKAVKTLSHSPGKTILQRNTHEKKYIYVYVGEN